MRILFVHNTYRKHGGEDTVVNAEVAQLSKGGHEVRVLKFDNARIVESGFINKVMLACRTWFSVKAFCLIDENVIAFRPDVIHFHNTFPLVSPFGYYAAKRRGVPVVQTLHNYRLLCANGMLLRDGHPCEKCLTGSKFNAVRYKCYRNSRSQTMVVVLMNMIHTLIGTWRRQVDRYIILTNFSGAKFSKLHISSKLRLKRNFLLGHQQVQPSFLVQEKPYFMFAGRLSEEKGIDTLLKAWSLFRTLAREYDVELLVVGDGPLKDMVIKESCLEQGIKYIGPVSKESVLGLVSRAKALVVPSIWYEGAPMVIVEAFSQGTPVIASHIGSLSEMVTNGEDGITFEPDDVIGLSHAIERIASDGQLRKRLSSGAYRTFARYYTEDKAYQSLMDIYSELVMTKS